MGREAKIHSLKRNAHNETEVEISGGLLSLRQAKQLGWDFKTETDEERKQAFKKASEEAENLCAKIRFNGADRGMAIALDLLFKIREK